MATSEVTGFVLAGGKSSRMGQDKATLSLDGKTLLERALRVLSDATAEAFILGSRELYGGQGKVIEDHFPGCGPLAGIHAALSATRTEYNLIIAVDVPFLSGEFLRYMVSQAITSKANVTAPEIGGYAQPLCSVYSRGFLPIAEQALKDGNYKIVPLFPPGSTRMVSSKELAQFAFTEEMFENLNTPEDLQRARHRSITHE